jgi:hypothetical protein
MHVDKQIACATVRNGLYELNLLDRALLATDIPECIHVWHQRFGHRDPNAIKLLQQQAEGVQIKNCSHIQVCECCIKAKMTRKPLPKGSDSTSTEVLQLIHSDLCGPMQNTTPSGNRYFMTMIDDFSRYTVLYLLNNKSEATAKIKEYVKFVQTKFKKTPQVIRSDNGGEYVNDELSNFLRSEGIQSQRTVAHTPEQNGVAERKNRYLVAVMLTRPAVARPRLQPTRPSQGRSFLA